jgi:hypothetical protein
VLENEAFQVWFSAVFDPELGKKKIRPVQGNSSFFDLFRTFFAFMFLLAS